MMRVLTFFALLFGLFGIYITQYKALYKSVYQLWNKEIVHDTEAQTHGIPKLKPYKHETCKICSEIESYCREFCDLTNTLTVLFIGIFITGILAIYASNANLIGASYQDAVILRCVKALILILLFSLQVVLKTSHVDIIKQWQTSQIDRKLFVLWCKVNCYESKPHFQNNIEPPRMYAMLSHKVEEYIKKNELGIMLKEKAVGTSPISVNCFILPYIKLMNSPRMGKCPDDFEEKIIWNFINDLHKDSQKWFCLESNLNKVVQSEFWNSIYPRLGEADKVFLRSLISFSLVLLIIAIVFVVYPEFTTSQQFNNTTVLIDTVKQSHNFLDFVTRIC